MKHYLFVYGLLRQDSNQPMSKYLKKNARHVDRASFQGKLYMVNHYPGAIPSPEKEDWVRGDLYEFEGNELLSALDEFEEVGPSFASPNEYTRKLCQVRRDDNQEITAWVYLYNHPINSLKEIESGDFLR